MLLLTWKAKGKNAGNAKVNRSTDTTLIAAATNVSVIVASTYLSFSYSFSPLRTASSKG